MPIVGMPIAFVICFAISATTISNTTEKAPAFSTACASCNQSFHFGLGAAFNFVAAFFPHTLRQHPNVPHERNSCLDDRFDLRDMGRAAFEFYRLCAGIDKLFSRIHRLPGRVVRMNRHISDE